MYSTLIAYIQKTHLFVPFCYFKVTTDACVVLDITYQLVSSHHVVKKVNWTWPFMEFR